MEIDTQSLSKCIRRASNFRPCLCDFESDEAATIDLYIKNTTKYTFKLEEESNIVATGSFGTPTPGFWLVPPPKRICGGETVFIRAYSGKVSTSDINTCVNPVDYTISVKYTQKLKRVKDQTHKGSTFQCPSLPYKNKGSSSSKYVGLDTFYIEVRALREASESSTEGTTDTVSVGCDGLKPFEPVSVVDFSSNFPMLNIYNLQAQLEDPRWRNTAFFLLS